MSLTYIYLMNFTRPVFVVRAFIVRIRYKHLEYKASKASPFYTTEPTAHSATGTESSHSSPSLTTVRLHACTAGQYPYLVALNSLKLRQHPFNLAHFQNKFGHLFAPEPLLVYPIEGSILHLRVVELEVACCIFENFPVMKQNGSRILSWGCRSQSRSHNGNTG